MRAGLSREVGEGERGVCVAAGVCLAVMACNLKLENAALDNVTLLGNILKRSLVITGFHTLGRLENVVPSQKF